MRPTTLLGARRPTAIVVAALLGAAGACVSTPRPAGPTALFGALPAPDVGASAGADRAPGASAGPLRFVDPTFAWTHASSAAAAYRWQATVENPAHSDFRVTVVMQLVDEAGRPLASSNRSFHLDGGDRVTVDDEGTLEGGTVSGVAGWRLEYWVTVPPRPVRD